MLCVVAIAVAGLFAVTKAGPLCYQCDHVTSPADCHKAVDCLDNQRCYTQKLMDFSNNTYNKLGCIYDNACQILPGSFIGKRDAYDHKVDKPKSRQATDTILCLQCCAGDACNNKGECGIVDGYWSHWSSYGSCSVSCCTGIRTRTRTCDRPAPAHGGKTCHGSSNSSTTCVNSCKGDAKWAGWGHWTGCTATCGGGTKTRTRTCTNQTACTGPCLGSSKDSQACGANPCRMPSTNTLRCFDCATVDDPTACDKVTECNLHHLCYVHHGPGHANHRLVYDMGCMPPLQCKGAKLAYKDIGCFQCCDNEDYCNFNACAISTSTNSTSTSTTSMTRPATTPTTTPTLTAAPVRPPEVTISPGSKANVPYNTAFSAFCGSQPGNKIKWFFSGTQPGQQLPPGVLAFSNGSLIFDHVNENNTGAFKCLAVSPITGLITSKTIDIKIVEAPATVLYIEKIPLGYISDGQQFALRCHVIGYPLPNVTWSFADAHGGNTVPSSVRYLENDRVLAFDKFDHQHNDGVWTCTATNKFGPWSGHVNLS